MTPFWDDRVADFVSARIPNCARGFGECRALGVHNGQGIVAGVVFHNWSPEDKVIEISSAATDPRWLTKRVMREAFGYAFDGLGCRFVIARIHEHNKRARRLWKGLGASEYVIPGLRSGAAEAVYTLSKEQWKRSKFN